MRQLGAEAVFVGSGIYKSSDPKERAKAIVTASTYYDRPDILAEISTGLGEAMASLDVRKMDDNDKMAGRDW
jgi:pyridoxal 5'-phosphate synthase pdxS subunit